MEGARSLGIEFENLKATELTLGLPWVDDEPEKPAKSKKRALEESETKVIGWPPVRSSFRKNNTHTKKSDGEANMLVKVSKDGAPYLRKIDINMYQGYKELTKALEIMFVCFSSNESLQDSIAYEDKDGDLMLVGDVPWDMFISSCKRLRIMK